MNTENASCQLQLIQKPKGDSFICRLVVFFLSCHVYFPEIAKGCPQKNDLTTYIYIAAPILKKIFHHKPEIDRMTFKKIRSKQKRLGSNT